MGTTAPRRSAAFLAVRVGTVAVVAGAVVAWMALGAGLGACGSPGQDPGCADLVRTLATRMGLAVAGMTAVIVLTMVGLARTGPSDLRSLS